MRSLIFILLLFSATAYAQQRGPYAEFYSMVNDTMRIQNSFRITSGGIKVRIFSGAGKELKAKITEAEISLVQKSVAVRTFRISDSNEIYFNDILAYSRPEDRVIIKIKGITDLERKVPIYLSKTDFSFTLQ
jgi:hypothetical protein